MNRKSYKISVEFAIVIIFLIAGIFAYSSWEKGVGRMFISSENMRQDFSKNNNITKIEVAGNVENWKLFRNEVDGNELNLPRNWKIVEGEDRFISENSTEEISIQSEDNLENYSSRELFENAVQNDKNSNVKNLIDQEGICIEKREGDMISQTVKAVLGEKIVTIAYSSKGTENSGVFLDKIVPTLKAIDK